MENGMDDANEAAMNNENQEMWRRKIW